MTAIQQYKIHPQRAIIHEVTGLNEVESRRSQSSMADSSTATGPILNQIAGDCWARRQLSSGIKDVSLASRPMKLLALVGVVFIGTLAIPEFDGRFLGSHWADPGSDCGGLLGSTPATQWYKVRSCRIKAHKVAVICAVCIRYSAGDILLDGRYLDSQ